MDVLTRRAEKRCAICFQIPRLRGGLRACGKVWGPAGVPCAGRGRRRARRGGRGARGRARMRIASTGRARPHPRSGVGPSSSAAFMPGPTM